MHERLLQPTRRLGLPPLEAADHAEPPLCDGEPRLVTELRERRDPFDRRPARCVEIDRRIREQLAPSSQAPSEHCEATLPERRRMLVELLVSRHRLEDAPSFVERVTVGKQQLETIDAVCG